VPPANAKQLAERAHAAKRHRTQEVSPRPRLREQSPCAHLHGRWRVGDSLLTLEAYGAGFSRTGNASERSVRWLCMQDGTVEVMASGGAWRMSRDANDQVRVTMASGETIDAIPER
jgi:hypothetical protein